MNTEPPHVNDLAPVKIKKSRFSTGALVLSVVVHLVLVLSVWNIVVINGSIPKSALTADINVGEGPSEALPEETPEVPLEVGNVDLPAESMSDSASGAPAPDLIVSESLLPAQNFTIPQTVYTSSAGNVPGTGGFGGTGAAGSGNGQGPGGSVGGAKTVSPFGRSEKTENGVVGYFYDIKQTPDRKETGASLEAYHDLAQKFTKSWDTSLLKDYYKTSEPLYLEQIRIPMIQADEAPKAFGVEKEVQPRQWIIHYQGTVASPETGTFRFLGFADDILVVAIDKKVVFDGSKNGLVENREAIPPWFKLRKGEKIPIDILLGEQPGGGFGAYLAIQNQKDEKELPQLVQFAKAGMPDMTDMTGITLRMSDKPFVFK